MFATDFDKEGGVFLTSQAELLEFIKKRPAFNANHFMFGFNESDLPVLAAHVKDDCCIIHFLSEDENYISVNDDETMDGVEVFYENKAGSKIEMTKDCVVPVEKWTEAAVEFFVAGTRPMYIQWMKL
jgi:hypothetical protein